MQYSKSRSTVFFSRTFLYLVFILFLGATVQRKTLLTDFMIAVRVSAVEFLLLAGIYVSSMSSCLGAMYGTPRVLQSIALENVIPAISILGKGVSHPEFSHLKLDGIEITENTFFLFFHSVVLTKFHSTQ